MPTSLPRPPTKRPWSALEWLAIMVTLSFIGLTLCAAFAPEALSAVIEYAFASGK
ncbi:MAG TPA: hypothetical protein VHA77_03265 [Xanthobacteraceae bacterium]|jgi:hypothetical protein|nr:hypothetical protein [Xanthobacteraceae bacterium]